MKMIDALNPATFLKVPEDDQKPHEALQALMRKLCCPLCVERRRLERQAAGLEPEPEGKEAIDVDIVLRAPLINTMPGCAHIFCAACINDYIEGRCHFTLRKRPRGADGSAALSGTGGKTRGARPSFTCPICALPAYRSTLRPCDPFTRIAITALQLFDDMERRESERPLAAPPVRAAEHAPALPTPPEAIVVTQAPAEDDEASIEADDLMLLSAPSLFMMDGSHADLDGA